MDSNLQDKFSATVNSGGRFVFGLVVLIFTTVVMFTTNYFVSAVIIYLLIGLSLLSIPNLGLSILILIALGIFASLRFGPVISAIEPFPLVITGAILLQFGFTKLHDLQLMRNIPRSKIRSVAVGAVEISGTIVSKNVITAPYSKSPCVYCQSEMEIYSENTDSDSDNYSDWQKIPGTTMKVPFWVKDETGQIMVDPEGAEFRITDTELGMLNEDGTPENADDAVSEDFSPKPGDRRYVEQILAPNDPVFILGTATLRKDGAMEQLVIQGGADCPFIISQSRQQYATTQEKWDVYAGISYGILIFINGFLGILYLSNLL